jgi:hypothetical protein
MGKVIRKTWDEMMNDKISPERLAEMAATKDEGIDSAVDGEVLAECRAEPVLPTGQDAGDGACRCRCAGLAEEQERKGLPD